MAKKEGLGLSATTLKIIAIVGMTMDHIGYVFWAQLPVWWRCILFAPGGITFPVMAFLLVEGYRHTRNVKKYMLRLLVFALISLIPFIWALLPVFNVIFTLLLGLVTIYLYEHMENRVGFWLLFVAIILVTIRCDWALMGVPMVFCSYRIQDRKKRVIVPALIPWGVYAINAMIEICLKGVLFINVLPNLCYAFVGVTASIPLLLQYNGEKGNMPRYFFYAYYPGHLLLLAILYAIMTGDWSMV